MPNREKNRERIHDIALTGVLLGLNVLALYLAALGIAVLANLYVAVLLPFLLLWRRKSGMAWLLWLGTVLLAAFWLPNPAVALAYGLLGYYLMLRQALDGRLPRWLAFGLKCLWLLLSGGVYAWVAAHVLGMSLSWALLPVLVVGVLGSVAVVALTELLLKAVTPLLQRMMGS